MCPSRTGALAGNQDLPVFPAAGRSLQSGGSGGGVERGASTSVIHQQLSTEAR